ncbi:MAG: D-alanyl-D-alanine carboxypeptidase [Clostridia bacterium]|nr:D-alanyl-D-alanine carboxypeptidase [Clostridia bacterium]MCI9067141.1 D-alanyl-D-alanine carboxypeptidase [Lachnospiraceae bacterium]
MKNLSRVFCLLLGALYLFSVLCGRSALAAGNTSSGEPAAEPASLAEWPAGPSLEAEAGLLMDAKTGTVLFEKNGDEQLYPASITKLMTALLVLENASMSDVVTFSYEAATSIEYDSSNIAVTDGEQLTVEQCMYALLLHSANEVANGLAEHVAGSMDAFAEMMNNRARQLGCTNTHFVNAHGLHNEDHYSSCRDMALIMKELCHNETFIRLSSAEKYTIEPTNKQAEPRYLHQSHKMLTQSEYTYDGTVTGKNGYTPEAGNTLVTYAVRGDMELIAVSMKSNWKHYSDTIAMLNYGFDNFTSYNMADADIDALSELDFLSPSQSVFDTSAAGFKLSDDGWAILPNGVASSSLESSLALTADSSSGKIADITYTYQGVPLGYGALLLTDDRPEHFDFGAHAPKEAEDSGQEKQTDGQNTSKDGNGGENADGAGGSGKTDSGRSDDGRPGFLGSVKKSLSSVVSRISDNPWLLLWAAGGILVLILFLFLIRKLWQLWKRRPPKNPTLVRARQARKDFRRRYRKRHKRFRRESETMERR